MAALSSEDRFTLRRYLGPDLVENDAEARLEVFGNVYAVAFQMLGEARAEMLASPAKLNAAGDVSADYTENLRRIDGDLVELSAKLTAIAADLNEAALGLIEKPKTVAIYKVTDGPELRSDGR